MKCSYEISCTNIKHYHQTFDECFRDDVLKCRHYFLSSFSLQRHRLPILYQLGTSGKICISICRKPSKIRVQYIIICTLCTSVCTVYCNPAGNCQYSVSYLGTWSNDMSSKVWTVVINGATASSTAKTTQFLSQLVSSSFPWSLKTILEGKVTFCLRIEIHLRSSYIHVSCHWSCSTQVPALLLSFCDDMCLSIEDNLNLLWCLCDISSIIFSWKILCG